VSVRSSFRALGTSAVVAVADPAALALARRLLAQELDRIDRACSRFRDDSELARANARAGEPVQISSFFAACVRVALDAAIGTGGLVTPALGEHLLAAGYDRTFALVRARDRWTFREVPPAPDAWRRIELDERRRILRVPPGTRLDLGATAKAFAADRAAAAIATATDSGVLVALGGDVAVAGPAPGGGWPVLVADDHEAELDGAGPVVAVAAGGLATSSTVVRSWPADGGTAHHVLDPRTGRPARTPWRTVSVAARSCVEANVAATAALVAGADAPQLLARKGVHARLVRRDGEVERVGLWPEERLAA